MGDPLPIPSHLPLASERELAARFGGDFAVAALALPAGEWSEPLRSTYGVHLVWVHERVAGARRALESVRSAVVEGVRQERAERAVRVALARWRPRYDVIVAR